MGAMTDALSAVETALNGAGVATVIKEFSTATPPTTRMAAMIASASASGRWAEKASLMERFNSSTRQPILTKAARNVAKVAPRQRDRFGAAMRSACRSQ